jgi:hypothetical protein
MSIKSKLQALRSGVSFFGLVVAFSSQYYPAHAGAGTIMVLDSTGTTKTFDVVTDGSGNFIQKSGIFDYAAGANGASVDASHNLGVVVGEALPGGTATLGVVNVLAITNALPGGSATIGAVIPGVIGSWGLTPSTTPGSAPTNALVGGAVFSNTPPTVGTGQAVALQSDSSGFLKVNIAAGLNNNGQATVTASAPVTQDTGVRIGQAAAVGNALILSGGAYNSTTPTLATAQGGQMQISARGGVLYGSQYPAGAIPIQATALGTTGVVTATLAGLTLATTYLCTMSVRSNANAAATGTVVVTGPITTLSYAHWTGVSSLGIGVTEMIFSPCVNGSAAGAVITVASPAPGTGGVVSVDTTGYQL